MHLQSIRRLQQRMDIYDPKVFQDLRTDVVRNKSNTFFSMNLAQIASLHRSSSQETIVAGKIDIATKSPPKRRNLLFPHQMPTQVNEGPEDATDSVNKQLMITLSSTDIFAD